MSTDTASPFRTTESMLVDAASRESRLSERSQVLNDDSSSVVERYGAIDVVDTELESDRDASTTTAVQNSKVQRSTLAVLSLGVTLLVFLHILQTAGQSEGYARYNGWLFRWYLSTIEILFSIALWRFFATILVFNRVGFGGVLGNMEKAYFMDTESQEEDNQLKLQEQMQRFEQLARLREGRHPKQMWRTLFLFATVLLAWFVVAHVYQMNATMLNIPVHSTESEGPS